MPKKILLADDSITIQKVVELTFSDGDYEVSAVNNGAKAIQKLSELRPDIILSDIIMPEKNGYEVCEYVKSHPEYRNIPVVLLTGTFEPFDPDRADKAGCDAVVTKPFESQSLIQKVEELISASQSAPATPAAAEPVPEPASFAADTSPWAEPEPTPASEPEPAFPAHDADIFSAPAMPEPPAMETPFDSGSFGGETRAFPRMSFEELQQMTAEPAPTPPPSPEPEPTTGGETRAFPGMSFEEMQQMAAETPAEERSTQAFPPLSMDEEHVVTPEPSPWDAGPAESAAAGDTMSPFAEPFAEPEPPPASEPEASPWDQPPAFSGETRAFPKMSFEEMQAMMAPPAAPEPPPAAPTEPPAAAAEPSPWDEPAPLTGGETRAFPKMSFEEMQAMASASAPAEEPSPAPFEESLAQQEAPFEPEMTAPPSLAEEPAWSPTQPEPAPSVAPAAMADLTDEQIDKIARRVVELMSEQVVRNIAWEVIPDLAEMVVKERIRQLEAQD